jgi:hypothetical protein
VKRFPNVCTKANGNIAKSCIQKPRKKHKTIKNRTNVTVTEQYMNEKYVETCEEVSFGLL